MKQDKFTLLIALLMLATAAWSSEIDDAARLEQERQAAFRAGFTTIVESLNAGSFDLFAKSIDRNDFLERIFGLRLIDQRIKKDFAEQMQTQFANFLQAGFRDSKDGVKATLLGIESNGDRGRAVVRYDLPELQFSYHSYELLLDKKNRLVIVDWTDYLQGERFSDGVGNSLVMAAPGRPAVRKLIDYQNVKDSDMFQFTELLKAARDRNAKRYAEIINSLNPELQRQRVVVLAGVQLAKLIRNRRMLRTALMQMAQFFPEEPLYTLMLLDYYVPAKLYDEALAALQRTYGQLGFDDAAMEARLSAIALAMGNTADASAFAARALELEPGLELAWWSALRARVAVADHAGAVEALQNLEQKYGHTLGAAELERDRTFAPLLASDEFLAWAASRK
jgi:tetratricopeptide (TPR) repeat protein